MKQLKKLIPNIALALLVLGGMVVFAAQNETVSRALGIARPVVKVQISGTLQRNNQTLAADQVEAVKTGETLDWTINSVNESSAAAQNYRVVGQIPKGTVYVADSATGEGAPDISYSIDGGKNFSAQPTIAEKQPDGTVKTVPAPVSMFTQVRYEWSGSLAVGAKLDAFYRVRVK